VLSITRQEMLNEFHFLVHLDLYMHESYVKRLE